jgi:lactaldehyde reductase
MDIKRIVLNEVSYFGPGARSILPEEIKRRGFKKSLIVTDKDLIKYHVVNKVTDILIKNSILFEIFDEV